MPKKPKVLLMDTDVLIDYQNSDFSVLGLVDKHVGEVYVLTTILNEVDGLNAVDCERGSLHLSSFAASLNRSPAL